MCEDCLTERTSRLELRMATAIFLTIACAIFLGLAFTSHIPIMLIISMVGLMVGAYFFCCDLIRLITHPEAYRPKEFKVV